MNVLEKLLIFCQKHLHSLAQSHRSVASNSKNWQATRLYGIQEEYQVLQFQRYTPNLRAYETKSLKIY